MLLGDVSQSGGLLDSVQPAQESVPSREVHDTLTLPFGHAVGQELQDAALFVKEAQGSLSG